MDIDKLINSDFAKENIKAYFYYWRCMFIEGIISLAIMIVLVVCFRNLFIPLTNDNLKGLAYILFFIFILMLYNYLISIQAIKIKKDIMKKDIVFEKIIVEKVDFDDNFFKKPIWYNLDNLFPAKLFVEKMNIFYFDHFGKKRKLRMIMSGKKFSQIAKFEEQKIELPVYFLRTSGLVIAIMDKNASSQDKMYYKSLNSMI